MNAGVGGNSTGVRTWRFRNRGCCSQKPVCDCPDRTMEVVYQGERVSRRPMSNREIFQQVHLRGFGSCHLQKGINSSCLTSNYLGFTAFSGISTAASKRERTRCAPSTLSRITPVLPPSVFLLHTRRFQKVELLERSRKVKQQRKAATDGDRGYCTESKLRYSRVVVGSFKSTTIPRDLAAAHTNIFPTIVSCTPMLDTTPTTGEKEYGAVGEDFPGSGIKPPEPAFQGQGPAARERQL